MAQHTDGISDETDQGIDDIVSGAPSGSSIDSVFPTRAAPFSADEVAGLGDMNSSTHLL